MKLQVTHNAKGPQRFWFEVVDKQGKTVVASAKSAHRGTIVKRAAAFAAAAKTLKLAALAE